MSGVGCASTLETIRLARKAQEIGFEAVMVIAPYFNKPNQEQIYEHFRQVAESVSVNVILYNIPIFPGVNIEPETLARLSRIGIVGAFKNEAETNTKKIQPNNNQ